MSIEPLSAAVRDYFRAFDLTAIALMRDGCITAKRDPAGAATAWWCEAVKAGPVIRAARRHGGDIPSAARALGVALTGHATVLARNSSIEYYGRAPLPTVAGGGGESSNIVNEPAGN